MFHHNDLSSLQQSYELTKSEQLLERDIEQLEKLAINYTACNQLGVPLLGGLLCELCDAVLDMHTVMIAIDRINTDDLQEISRRLNETRLDELCEEILADFPPPINTTAKEALNSINHNYQATKKELCILIDNKIAACKKMDYINKL